VDFQAVPYKKQMNPRSGAAKRQRGPERAERLGLGVRVGDPDVAKADIIERREAAPMRLH